MSKVPDKIIYGDLETTGLDANKNGIIQIALILERKGLEIDRWTSFVAPAVTDEITEDALKITSRTREEIETFPQPVVVAASMVQFLSKHISPYDPKDKWALCGHNSAFDKNFLYSFFRRYTSVSLHNFVHVYLIDTYAMAQLLWLNDELPGVANLKLPTLAEYMKIPHRAHEALSDTEVARDLFKIFNKMLRATNG